MNDPTSELRNFYGRIHGKTLRASQKTYLAEDLGPLSVSNVTRDANPARTPLDVASLTQGRPLWLEIGFGGGEHLLWQAAHTPTVNMIGCEPFEDGVVKVLDAIEAQGLRNIQLHPDDARDLLRLLPDQSIARAFVLFPDPWPKRRHVKRRLVGSGLLRELARVLKQDAELRIGTDIADYARTMLMAFQSEPAFQWQAERPQDWQIRPQDWPQTRYEDKAVREGRRSAYLIFRRV